MLRTDNVGLNTPGYRIIYAVFYRFRYLNSGSDTLIQVQIPQFRSRYTKRIYRIDNYKTKDKMT